MRALREKLAENLAIVATIWVIVAQIWYYLQFTEAIRSILKTFLRRILP
jgi:hypothetical protein